MRRASAYSGFGLLPDGAWTATRYACPGRRASGKQNMNIKVSVFCQDKFTTVCYNDITNLQLNV